MSIVRMNTRAIVVVHSHIQKAPDNGTVNLSDDVIAISTQKSIKGPGGATLTVVPRRNYFNLIYPNDVINIYFDPGDGKRGFVRTFFGYVDRVERSVTTDDKGATSTSFRITCTDMTKVFDRTDIYFNPNLANRQDFLETRFGQSMLAGHALRTRGIRAHGTPTDMVENLAAMLLGFGAQWILPESYKNASTGLQKNRQKRLNRTKARVAKTDIDQITSLAGNPEDLLKEEQHLEDLAKIINDNIQLGTNTAYFSSVLKRKKQMADLLEGSMTLSAYRTALKETAADFPYTILDLIDLSFIEAMSIDGYIASTSIWQKQGSLASLMYGYSNEVVNELFFDLRPVMVDEGDGLADSCFGKTYSHEPDELGINVTGTTKFPITTRAVKYVPAIVMREYPYSTSEGIDLKNLFISDVGGTYDFVAFGPVFSKDVNNTRQAEPKRAIYDYKDVGEIVARGGLSPNSLLFEPISEPLKHLDVVPIKSEDVKDDTLGRSDNDVFNLFALSAEDPLQKNWKYLLQDLFPIVTPVSIERHGLRVMEMSTMYANYSQDNLSGIGSAIDNVAIRRNLARWAFLLDHWNQHNHEYLSGDLTLRGMPEIRVGYRLDHVDRHESYYVEEVKHSWQYPETMTTTVTVSRGQRNDPMPAYIPPSVSRDFGKPLNSEDATTLANNGAPLRGGLFDSGFVIEPSNVASVTGFAFEGGGNRRHDGRLGDYFFVNPTHATATSTQGKKDDRNNQAENYMDKNGAIDGAVSYSMQESEAVRTGFISSSTDEAEEESERYASLVNELGEEEANRIMGYE